MKRPLMQSNMMNGWVRWCLAATITSLWMTSSTGPITAQDATAGQAGVATSAAGSAADDPAMVQISQSDLARLVGPRALSRAFRYASKRATPGVVTVLCYGQGQPPSDDDDDKSEEDLDEQLEEKIPDPGIPGMPTPDPPEGDEGESPLDEQEKAPVPDEDLGPVPPPKAPDDPDAVLTGLGSGVIVDPSGLVITNQHVVRGASKVVVQMSTEVEYSAVKIVGDPASDIAILRIESDQSFPSVEVGDSDRLEIGDWVLAIGSPFKLDATVSAGIISAKDRKLRRIQRGRMLQTDAAINPGNSGGPLIDLDGKVVAINTAIASRNGGNQGIGFAIPINHAFWLANELDQHGKVRRAAMGIRLAELNANIAAKFSLKPGIGVLAYQVIEDSAADKAGIENYDVITSFAGQPTRNMVELQEIVERTPIGSTQTVTILRDGESITLQIQLAPLEDVTAVPQP
ncbi:S1C family serine protease [Crateriforma conspicua]|uniref:S1C family serine protease n=1 Tax=Crateriforma conspicua TaxID=2527996 RepID=UPI0018C8BF94|nr:trypsin-like peptidase domain-containing protein [Crateriforma conspicua]